MACIGFHLKTSIDVCLVNPLFYVARVVFDRGFTEWDEGLMAMNVDCATMTPDSTSEYVRHIRHNSM